MRSFDGVIAALAGVAAALLLAAPAAADSRIFTVKSSEPGVTIDQAFRNGKELAVVGHGDGTTLFRIDEPSTPVGCANRLDFVTSTGEKLNLAADLCVLNWDVTVEVKAAPSPAPAETAAEPPAEAPPAADASPAPPAETPPDVADVPAVPAEPEPAANEPARTTQPTAPGATFTQTVTVSGDDPNVTIAGLSLDGKLVTITRQAYGTVQFEIEGNEQGIVCERNLGLVLSDGRRIDRKVNLCLNDWKVAVSLSGEATAPAEPPPLPAASAAPQPEPQTPPPAEPPPQVTAMPVLPAPPAEGMVWTFAVGEIAATLAHGVPQSDASDFVATCNRGGDRVTITLYSASLPGLAPKAAIPVTFFAGAFTKTYPGVGSEVDEDSGASHPELVISAGDPLWTALIHEANLGIAAGAWTASLSLKGSAAPARQLLAACLSQPVAPPPVMVELPRGKGITANYFCENGSGITVTYYGGQQAAVLVEPGAPPLSMRWTPDGRRGRYVAGDARLVIRDEDVRWSRLGGQALTCTPR